MAAYTSTTVFGKPTSGQFAVDDTFTDAAGVQHQCIRAGLPGEWVAAGPVGVTVAEAKIAADSASRAEIVTATNVITAAESGKTFFLNSTTEFVSTLPAPAIGLKYSFVVTGAPAAASYTVVTDSAAELIIGRVLCSADAAGDTENTAGGTTVTFVDGQAVMGDRLDIESDGTNWYCVGICAVAAGITITG